MKTEDGKLRHRVIVLGDTGVGKSSLINHLIGKEVTRVGAVGSVTSSASVFLLNDNLELVDTRGTEEAGSNGDPWQDLEDNLLEYQPSLVIWILPGYARHNLDENFQKLETLLNSVFEKTRLDPYLIIVANKMDMLEPPGAEYLPKAWPDFRKEKGRNIQARLKQLSNLHIKFINSRLCCLEPTFLDWCRGSKPWNIDGIRSQLGDLSARLRGQIIRRMSLSVDQFAQMLAIQCRALEMDIEATIDADEKAKKVIWAQEYFKSVEYQPVPYDSFDSIPTDVVTRNAFISQILLFTPFFIPFGRCEEKITFKQKAFPDILLKILCEKGVTCEESQAFLKKFSEAGKELDPGFLNLRNLLKLAVAVVIGGALMWWMAPVVGGWLGAWLFGLHGAAAVSAGLAWLGLGSLAAGGFGMFGGTVVIVGAGSILAGGTSAIALKSLSSNLGKHSALLDCSRTINAFDVILSEIKTGKISKQDALDYIQYFASTMYRLHAELKTKEAEFAKDKKHGKRRLAAYKDGLTIYDRALELLEKRRNAAGIKFYRETD